MSFRDTRQVFDCRVCHFCPPWLSYTASLELAPLKVLPCLHTICRSCVYWEPNHQTDDILFLITCPLCSSAFQCDKWINIPSSGFDELPGTCCKRHYNSAIMCYCHDCSKTLCRMCLETETKQHVSHKLSYEGKDSLGHIFNRASNDAVHTVEPTLPAAKFDNSERMFHAASDVVRRTPTEVVAPGAKFNSEEQRTGIGSGAERVWGHATRSENKEAVRISF